MTARRWAAAAIEVLPAEGPAGSTYGAFVASPESGSDPPTTATRVFPALIICIATYRAYWKLVS